MHSLKEMSLSMSTVSRRQFVRKTTAAATALAFSPWSLRSAFAAEKFSPPIVVFSKVYQTLSLSFDEAAAVTAEAGLDGVDAPLRPGGEILPERATEELPRYVETMHERKLQLPLLTTAIITEIGRASCRERV